MFLSFNPYLFYFLIILGLLILLVVITSLIDKAKYKLMLTEIETFSLEKGYEFQLSTDKRFDIIIKNTNFTMYIKLCKIPSNSSVTINSKTTWCLRFGGGNRKGRNYPNKRYLNELIPFLNLSKDDENLVKVVLFYPSTEVILKYLNESEICEIKPIDISYGYKAISYNEFTNSFDELLKTKKQMKNTK